MLLALASGPLYSIMGVEYVGGLGMARGAWEHTAGMRVPRIKDEVTTGGIWP